MVHFKAGRFSAAFLSIPSRAGAEPCIRPSTIRPAMRVRTAIAGARSCRPLRRKPPYVASESGIAGAPISPNTDRDPARGSVVARPSPFAHSRRQGGGRRQVRRLFRPQCRIAVKRLGKRKPIRRSRADKRRSRRHKPRSAGSCLVDVGSAERLGRDDGPARGSPHHTLLRRQSLPASARYGVGASTRSRPSCFSSAQSAGGIV